ncbi:hypothetical protein LZ30DRAFT_255334 [Colletotrichum cereale]|nr:hypothetical protein LZ30DRAFT_255334 [Colletotrichum cereale]
MSVVGRGPALASVVLNIRPRQGALSRFSRMTKGMDAAKLRYVVPELLAVASLELRHSQVAIGAGYEGPPLSSLVRLVGPTFIFINILERDLFSLCTYAQAHGAPALQGASDAVIFVRVFPKSDTSKKSGETRLMSTPRLLKGSLVRINTLDRIPYDWLRGRASLPSLRVDRVEWYTDSPRITSRSVRVFAIRDSRPLINRIL